jgi:ABC-type branched-subunit amino acid transport system ATPase component
LALLTLAGVTKRFGGLTAVDGVGFAVDETTVCGVIGPNGAGKTTLFNLITGITRPDEGQIVFGGSNLVGDLPEDIARRGISRTFQNIRLFRNLSSLENVMVGAANESGRSLVHQLLTPWRARERLSKLASDAASWLDWVGFKGDLKRLPHELPYGDQRRIEIARALATKPRLLILDEPTAGMVAKEAHQVIELIHRLKEIGMTVLLIEHNMNVVMSVSDKVVVLNFGQKLADGSPQSIRADARVIEAYLGTDE